MFLLSNFINPAASHLATRRVLCSDELNKKEGFQRQKEGGTRKLKEWIISGKVTFWEGRGVLTGRLRRFLGEDESLGLYHGLLARMMPFWTCGFVLKKQNKNNSFEK